MSRFNSGYLERLVRFNTIIFSILLFIHCSEESEPAGGSVPVHTLENLDPVEQNAKSGRGINLGNILEAPAEGDWGLTLQAYYFDKIADAGFNSVRLPVR